MCQFRTNKHCKLYCSKTNVRLSIPVKSVSFKSFDYRRHRACAIAPPPLDPPLTITGLQKLLDYAEQFITFHGLLFNLIKTQCITFGKSRFSNRSLCLSGVALEEVMRITYLGVTLSNYSCGHSNDRTKSAKRAYYALQGAAICTNGTNTETLVHLYQAAIRPVLMYLVCVHQNKTAIDDVEKCQGRLHLDLASIAGQALY